MKRSRLLCLITVLLVLFCILPGCGSQSSLHSGIYSENAYAQETEAEQIYININGTPVGSDVSPYIKNDRTFVPVRVISEHMGAKVDWLPQTNEIVVALGGKTVTLRVGDTAVKTANGTQQIDAAPEIAEGRTMVPIRFIAEFFGFGVEWNEQTRTVMLSAEGGKNLTVHFLDVGQGDSIFVQFPDGKTLLVDAGNPDDGENIVSYIKGLGVTKLDAVTATHPHADHIGGMKKVIEELDAEKYYFPKASTNTATFENTLKAISAKGKKITTAKAGVVLFETESYSAKFVAPGSDSYEELNDYSAVILIKYKNRKILLSGDAEKVSESEMVYGGEDISADVLKVGHHGSHNSSSAQFLNKVKPSVAVISVGADNSYGHPHSEALGRLQNIGATVYRTDINGTVIITTDGNSLNIDTKPTKTKTAATERQTESAASGDTVVYVTPKGKKYHLKNCSSLVNSKVVNAVSLAEAKKTRGACGLCHPPQ